MGKSQPRMSSQVKSSLNWSHPYEDGNQIPYDRVVFPSKPGSWHFVVYPLITICELFLELTVVKKTGHQGSTSLQRCLL